MKIDRSKLKIGIWYEDENGNMIPRMDDRPCDTCDPMDI